MQVIIEFLKSPQGIEIISSAVMILVTIIAVILRGIAANCKNQKLVRLIEILPDALEFAEAQGGEPDIKLENAYKYVLERIKGISLSTIIDAIENGITISKNINVNSKSLNESAVSKIVSRQEDKAKSESVRVVARK